ncbi:MAG: hypothetical protein ACKOHM_12235 [Spartobacteria bacterium]
MKDFLQGRPLAVGSSNRRGESPVANTPLPPISVPHTHPESIDLSDIAIDAEALPESITVQDSTGPQVELVPDTEGRIGHIVITCACGEKITLQCNY